MNVRDDRDIEATLVAARDLWADFPVHADPRPLVLTGGIFRVPGFTSDEAKKAFTQGAIEVADRVPDPAVRSLRRALPPRRPGGPALLLSDATSIESSFDTDRGPARLAAWQFDVSDTLGPMVVLDAGIVDRAWTPAGLPEDLHFMSRGDAVQSDPVTFTYRFMGSPSVYTDYPDVVILEPPRSSSSRRALSTGPDLAPGWPMPSFARSASTSPRRSATESCLLPGAFP